MSKKSLFKRKKPDKNIILGGRSRRDGTIFLTHDLNSIEDPYLNMNRVKCTFGKPIDVVPQFIIRCLEWLEENGLISCFCVYCFSAIEEEGIFRQAGVHQVVLDLKKQMSEGKEINLNDQKRNPHNVATLVKNFFAELPEPLCTYQCYDLLVECYKVHDKKDRRALLKAVLEYIPTPNRTLLGLFCKFLHKVTQHQQKNRMTASSLSIVLAHHLIKKKDQSSLEAMQSLNDRQAIFALMIKEAPYLFSKEKPDEFICQALEGEDVKEVKENLQRLSVSFEKIPPPLPKNKPKRKMVDCTNEVTTTTQKPPLIQEQKQTAKPTLPPNKPSKPRSYTAPVKKTPPPIPTKTVVSKALPAKSLVKPQLPKQQSMHNVKKIEPNSSLLYANSFRKPAPPSQSQKPRPRPPVTAKPPPTLPPKKIIPPLPEKPIPPKKRTLPLDKATPNKPIPPMKIEEEKITKSSISRPPNAFQKSVVSKTLPAVTKSQLCKQPPKPPPQTLKPRPQQSNPMDRVQSMIKFGDRLQEQGKSQEAFMMYKNAEAMIYKYKEASHDPAQEQRINHTIEDLLSKEQNSAKAWNAPSSV